MISIMTLSLIPSCCFTCEIFKRHLRLVNLFMLTFLCIRSKLTKPNLIIKNERIRAIYIIRDGEFLRKYLMDTSFAAKCNFSCVNSVRNRSYSGPHFPAFGLNREKYSVSFRIQSTCGKIRTKITLNTDLFCAVFTSFLNLKQTDQ